LSRSEPQLPQILERRELADTRFFRIEELYLRFANGEERLYERLPGVGTDAVIVVAMNAQRELLLIREYAAGFHEFQLTLPKGAAEHGETLEQVANRELKEEVGFGARQIQYLKRLSIAPGHMGFTIHVMLALDLYAERLPGDEPEPPELVYWPFDDLADLYARADFFEARAIAALALAAPYLESV
jgi:ADP-ribose diphosphatase